MAIKISGNTIIDDSRNIVSAANASFSKVFTDNIQFNDGEGVGVINNVDYLNASFQSLELKVNDTTAVSAQFDDGGNHFGRLHYAGASKIDATSLGAAISNDLILEVSLDKGYVGTLDGSPNLEIFAGGFSNPLQLASNGNLQVNGQLTIQGGNNLFVNGGSIQAEGDITAEGSFNTYTDIQVGSTTVINSSRQLLNIASITTGTNGNITTGSGGDLIINGYADIRGTIQSEGDITATGGGGFVVGATSVISSGRQLQNIASVDGTTGYTFISSANTLPYANNNVFSSQQTNVYPGDGYDLFKSTLSQDSQFIIRDNSVNGYSGRVYSFDFQIEQSTANNGPHTAQFLATFGSNTAPIVWQGGAAPTITEDNGAVDTITFLTTNGGQTWYGLPRAGGGGGGGGLFTEASAGVWETPSITTATVNGDFVVTGDSTSLSDERHKENITPVSNALDMVDNMNGVFYNLKSSPEKRSVGVIAQEMEKVLPEVVYEAEDFKSVAYGNIVGVLIEAIKEMRKEIKDLKDGIQ